MQRVKWLAALPSSTGLDSLGKATLIMYFVANGHTVEQIATMDQETLVGKIKFALQCDDALAAATAKATVELLHDLIRTFNSPPSVGELQQFIKSRQLQLQPKTGIMSIYDALTSDDPTYSSGTVDPLTGQPFNPVWLQLAIEQLYGLDPRR